MCISVCMYIKLCITFCMCIKYILYRFGRTFHCVYWSAVQYTLYFVLQVQTLSISVYSRVHCVYGSAVHYIVYISLQYNKYFISACK